MTMMSCKHLQPQRLRKSFEECLRLHLSCFKPIIKENDLETIPDYLSSHVSCKCILQTFNNCYCKNTVKVFSTLKNGGLDIFILLIMYFHSSEFN